MVTKQSGRRCLTPHGRNDHNHDSYRRLDFIMLGTTYQVIGRYYDGQTLTPFNMPFTSQWLITDDVVSMNGNVYRVTRDGAARLHFAPVNNEWSQAAADVTLLQAQTVLSELVNKLEVAR